MEPHLYKLLVYEKGGFFKPHRDSEKIDRMVASLIVALPNSFEVGRLIVRHAGRTQSFDFDAAKRGQKSVYAAFYADCEHEVQPVTYGLRVCLAYNLVLKTSPPKPLARPTGGDPLVEAMREWVLAHPAKPLVFALDHEYTSHGLARDLLKGADRARANLVVEAAERAGCRAQLAQLERRDVYNAFDGSEYGGWRRRGATGDYELQDLIEREFSATTWSNLDGSRLPWGAMPLDPEAVVSDRPFDDWLPDREEYEGYTGNAGNTLDRWYQRAGLVVWSRDHHYEILPRAGLEHALTELSSMIRRLPKVPESDRETARNDAKALARGILEQWPRRWDHFQDRGYYKGLESFPRAVLALDDRALASRFLRTVAERDQSTRLEDFAVEAGRRWGRTVFAAEWLEFIQPTTEPQRSHRDKVLPRDAAWLAALGDAGAAAEAPWIADASRTVADHFVRDRQPENREQSATAKATADEQVLPVLLKALYSAGLDELAERTVAFARGNPKRISRDTGSVPALVELVPWCRTRFGRLPDAVRDWLAAERAALEQAVAARPAPPTNWTRPDNVRCKCEFCLKLKVYLADPARETIAIPATESNRQHLVQRIESDELDVKSSLSKVGRPYSLVLTKTNRAHGRAVKRYELDQRLLESLPTCGNVPDAAIERPTRKRPRK